MIALAGVPVLETGRLRLRAPEAGDIPAWTAFMGTERARFVGGPAEAGPAWRVFAAIAGHWALRGYGSWTVTEGGHPVGLAGLWHPAGWPEPELAYTLWSGRDEGRGLAAEAVDAARRACFALTGRASLVSYIDPDNARSIRLAERLGARPDGAAPRRDGGEGDIVYRHHAEEPT